MSGTASISKAKYFIHTVYFIYIRHSPRVWNLSLCSGPASLALLSCPMELPCSTGLRGPSAPRLLLLKQEKAGGCAQAGNKEKPWQYWCVGLRTPLRVGFSCLLRCERRLQRGDLCTHGLCFAQGWSAQSRGHTKDKIPTWASEIEVPMCS